MVSTGDLFAVALVLAVVGRRAVPALVAFLAAGTVLVRWGSSSLDALAGAQAVFGPAVAVGTGPEAASAAVAAVALLLAPPGPGAGRRPLISLVLVSVPFGVLAAAVAWGPSYAGDPALRIATTVAGAALAAGATGFVPARLRHPASIACAAAALVLAAVG